MKIPIHIAEKLLQLLQGKRIPSSMARHPIIEALVLEGIIHRTGRIQKSLLLTDSKALENYLQNHLSINNLEQYIQIRQKEFVTRSELVSVSSDSKLTAVRTFKGFLVNCYIPIEARLYEKPLTIHPVDGTFQFIYDFEGFSLPSDITIVGVENPENFRYIGKQKYLFRDIKPLFVSRYPQNQSKDLIKWLQAAPNNYLHFGDYDFAGIGIYLNEFKKHLTNKATFLVPNNIDALIKKFGNRSRYDEQPLNFGTDGISEPRLLELINTIHIRRKGLDQEIFTNSPMI